MEKLINSKLAIPNKFLQKDGTVTDLTGSSVINSTIEYDSKPAIPNKFLNPDGSLLQIVHHRAF